MCVEYECNLCRRVQSVNDGPVAYYALPDGRGFFGPHGVGWCSLCRCLVEVEEVEGADAIEQRIEMVRQLVEQSASPDLEEHLQARAEWARMRTQPPRCLRCGSHGFQSLRRGEEYIYLAERGAPAEFRHPGCGGRFRLKEVLFSQPIPRYLSAEGELLEGRWVGVFRRWARRLWG